MDISAGQPPGVEGPVAEINLKVPPSLGPAVVAGAAAVVVGGAAGALVVAAGGLVVVVEEEQPERIKARTNRIDTAGTKNLFNQTPPLYLSVHFVNR
jgi:hypothetical protein